MSIRFRIVTLAAIAVAFPAAAGAQAPLITTQMEQRLAALEPKIVAWRRDIHQHPELGNRETRTAALVAEHLKKLGIETRTGVAVTGVVGVLKGGRPGPTVLLRADMDALPVTERNDLPFKSTVRTVYNGVETGVMHACGHDTHVAILMGVAELMAGMRDQIPGTVKFMFQPAEEGAPQGEEGGAKLMVKEGILESPKVDAAFALHISSGLETGHIEYTPGGMAASSDDLRITVTGKGTHGGYPWNGVDPIVTSAHIVTALQTIVSRQMELTQNASVVTIGKIAGGVRNNIIPETVEMLGTIRTLNPGDRAKVHERIRRVATNVAESMGATVDVQIGVGTAYPVTYNDPALTAQMVPVLEQVAGKARVQLAKAETGAEDFSFVAEKVPSVYISLGGRPANVKKEDASDHHTPGFIVADTDLDVGVKALTAMALAYMRTR